MLKPRADSASLYLLCFSDLGKMFHQAEKYDSDFTDTLSGFNAGVCVSMSVWMPENEPIHKKEKELREKRKRCDEMLYLQLGCNIFAQDC